MPVSPLRIQPLPERQLFEPGGSTTVIKTGAIGYLGASQEDQQRWLLGFRRLLDGLDAPLQVVMSFTPGTGQLPGGQPIPGRPADLAFAAELAALPSAQAREVRLVTGASSAKRLEAGLTEMAVPVLESEELSGWRARAVGVEKRNALVGVDGWQRAWYLDRFPGIELEPGWLLRLVAPEAEVRLSWHLEPLPSSWVVDFLQRQLINMRAARMEESAGGSADPALKGAMPNTEELQRRLTASEEKAFHASLYLSICCPDEARLEQVSEQVVAASRATLCELRACSFRMLDGVLATLPFGEDRLRRHRVLDTSSALTLFPWLDADIRHADGIVVGRSARTGCPVVLDAFDQTRYANANVGVFGHSGAGKTYLLSTLAMGALGQGTQVFVIDPEHEYGKLARALGGVDVSFALGSGQALNVLGLRADENLDEAWLGPAVADTVDLAAVICGDLDESERAIMEAAVREAYAEVREPLLGHVAERLPEASRTARILRRWSQGSLGAMFAAPTNIDLEAPIVVFGMRELREELIAPVHFLLAEALWRRIKDRKRRRLLVVDELGLLFEDATIRRFVVRLARRIRKYDGALVFATQNPGDLLSSEAGAVVATNPAINFFGAQRPGEAVKLQRVFQLSDAQRSWLETSRRGEFLLAAGQERLPVKVQAPAWQAEVMQSGRDPPRRPYNPGP